MAAILPEVTADGLVLWRVRKTKDRQAWGPSSVERSPSASTTWERTTSSLRKSTPAFCLSSSEPIGSADSCWRRVGKTTIQTHSTLGWFGVGILAALLVGCGTTESASPALPQAISTPHGSGGTNHRAVLSRPYVVLVSFDGFRPDYLERVETPAFDRLIRTGIIADGLISVFPSLTFPAHYSIATGLYPEHHGIVGNRFHDPVSNSDFDYRDRDDAGDGRWWGGEPIWVTAETQGMVSAALFFPGTEADIHEIRPTHWRPYDSSFRNTDRVQQALEWLVAPPPERPHLVTLYFSLVDGTGHRSGPDGPQLTGAISAADRLLGQLLDGIERMPHGDQVYVVVVSDHGMAAIDPERQVVLPEIAGLRGVRRVSNGPVVSLYLDGDDERGRQIRDDVNTGTTLATAYLRRDVPEHLHYRAHPRIGDVVVIPEEGASVRFRSDSAPPLGMHGWDPTLVSMHGIFLIRGPGLSPGQHIGLFESVDIYPLLAQVLGLNPPSDLDGHPGLLERLLKPSQN